MAADTSDVAVGTELSYNGQPVAFLVKISHSLKLDTMSMIEITIHLSILYEVETEPPWA